MFTAQPHASFARRLWRDARRAVLVLAASTAALADAPLAPPAPPSHLEHFGFYASAMGRWNFTAELAPFTTLTWIHVGSGDAPEAGVAEILRRVAEAEAAGVQAVVALEPFLFADAAGTPRPDDAIVDFLVDLRARLEADELLSTVAMLYPKDEPFREFRRARNPSFFEEYVTGEVYEDIHADLTHVNTLVKAAFPERPLGVILSGLELHHRFFAIPATYDWVGFDCYANLFDACEGRSFVQLYGRLLAHMAPHQRLMAVPEAWATHGETDNPDFPDLLGKRLRLHWEMALAEPRFVAFIPFLWSFEAPEDTPGVGLDRFPEFYDRPGDPRGSALVEQLRDLGRQVKAATTVYPNLAWSETEERNRPTGEVTGRILDVDAAGTVTVRALDTALPHKNLRVRLGVLDEAGRVLFKTRLMRTDRPAAIAVPDRPEDGLLLGTHDLTVQLPPALFRAPSNGPLEIVLRTYADGPGAVLADEDRSRLTGAAPSAKIGGPSSPEHTPWPTAPNNSSARR